MVSFFSPEIQSEISESNMYSHRYYGQPNIDVICVESLICSHSPYTVNLEVSSVEC